MIFDPFDMAPAQTLHLAAEFEIALDFNIIQYPEAVDCRQGRVGGLLVAFVQVSI